MHLMAVFMRQENFSLDKFFKRFEAMGNRFQLSWAMLHLSASIMHLSSAIYHLKRIRWNVNNSGHKISSDDDILGV